MKKGFPHEPPAQRAEALTTGPRFTAPLVMKSCLSQPHWRVPNLHWRSFRCQLGRFVGALATSVLVKCTHGKIILRIEFKTTNVGKGLRYIDGVLITTGSDLAARSFAVVYGVGHSGVIRNGIPGQGRGCTRPFVSPAAADEHGADESEDKTRHQRIEPSHTSPKKYEGV